MKKIVFVLLVAACSKQVLVKEPSPVMVTAAPPQVEPEPAPPPPPRVEVKADHIHVNEAIYFDSSRATIRSESNDLLDEIAQVINAHPELVKIRIEGHTDSVGRSRTNVTLSKKRAVSVRTYLIERGVDAKRLIAEGFGDENPIATNENAEGRAKNRRVAFTVLDRSDAPTTVSSRERGDS